MHPEYDYDIAVIGAGPAGSTFARLAAAGGRRILLVDGQGVYNRKPCGGLLAPDAQKVLAHFDLVLPNSVLADPQIFSVKTIDLEKRMVRYYQRYYLNMDRYAFDTWLLSLVPETVDIVEGKCLQAERLEDGFRLRIRAAGKEIVCRCSRLVGADGANSIVRRTFFRDRISRYVAIQQWFKSTEGKNPFYSCIFDPQTSDSCSWLMYKGPYVIYGGCFSPGGCRAAFEKQKVRLEDFLGYTLGEPEKTEACLVDRPRRAADFITGEKNVYLIGEAAGFISASSFEGISSAILSGSLLAAAFLEGEEPEDIAGKYRRKTWKLRLKLWMKIRKRWFMYTPWVRRRIMRSGLQSIDVHTDPIQDSDPLGGIEADEPGVDL